MPKNEKKLIFEGWFSICMPDTWIYSIEEDILTVYAAENGKGAIQISFSHLLERDDSLRVTAENHLNRFLNQFNVKTEENTYKVIEAPGFTLANASGEFDNEFIKVWTLVNEKKMLLVTYISPKKTRELSTVEDIIYSINFDAVDRNLP